VKRDRDHAIRPVIGGLCGVAASFAVWIAAHPFALWVPLIGAVFGAAYVSVSDMRRSYALDAVFTTAALGILLWVAVEVVAVPLLSSGVPAWSAAAMRGVFPSLAGWTLYGVTLGAATHLLARINLLPRIGKTSNSVRRLRRENAHRDF